MCLDDVFGDGESERNVLSSWYTSIISLKKLDNFEDIFFSVFSHESFCKEAVYLHNIYFLLSQPEYNLWFLPNNRQNGPIREWEYE